MDTDMAPATRRFSIISDVSKAYDNVDLDVFWFFISRELDISDDALRDLSRCCAAYEDSQGVNWRLCCLITTCIVFGNAGMSI